MKRNMWMCELSEDLLGMKEQAFIYVSIFGRSRAVIYIADGMHLRPASIFMTAIFSHAGSRWGAHTVCASPLSL